MQTLIPELAAERIPRAAQQHAVMGIDPSLTGLAACVALPGLPLYEIHKGSKPASSVRGRVARFDALAAPVLELARVHQPELVLLEGYSFGSKGRGTIDRAEFGGILRRGLVRALSPSACIVEVSPKSLKMFGADNGNADKAEMMRVLESVYGRKFRNDDQADAFALVMLGMAALGMSAPHTKKQRTVTLSVVQLIKAAA